MGRTQNTFIQFFRYLFVGGFAALVDTASFYFLYSQIGMHHLVAAAFGFFLGLAVNYLISISWVFESRGRFREEFALFAVIGAGGLLWTEFILWVAIDGAQLHPLVAKGIALILVLFWNFGMRKRFIFAEESR